MINVWLDDQRNPNQWGRKGFVWVKTVNDAVKILNKQDVHIISLDCDLSPKQYVYSGINYDNMTPTGVDLIRWMIRFKKIPDYVEIHSANDIARMKMLNLLKQHIEDSRILLLLPTKVIL